MLRMRNAQGQFHNYYFKFELFGALFLPPDNIPERVDGQRHGVFIFIMFYAYLIQPEIRYVHVTETCGDHNIVDVRRRLQLRHFTTHMYETALSFLTFFEFNVRKTLFTEDSTSRSDRKQPARRDFSTLKHPLSPIIRLRLISPSIELKVKDILRLDQRLNKTWSGAVSSMEAESWGSLAHAVAFKKHCIGEIFFI
jgi:hypothetical protein